MPRDLDTRKPLCARPLLSFIGCGIFFFLGRSSVVFDCPNNGIRPVAEKEQWGWEKNPEDVGVNFKCPVCETSDGGKKRAPSHSQMDEAIVFYESMTSDPQKIVNYMNKLCNVLMNKSSTAEGQKIGIGTIIFCYKHVLTYRREYSYAWDNVKSSEMGYYTGTDLPPYQMDMFQYSVIHSVIASIPAKPLKSKLEQLGSKFSDVSSNYKSWKSDSTRPRGSMGPQVLFWGCGSDTPMHSLLVKFLGGNITFIDNSARFIDFCKKSHPDIRLIEPTGNNSDHSSLIGKLVPPDGSALDTDDVNDPLTESQWMPNLSGVDTELAWDVIVIDGPAQDLGRSQPLYMAKRLAQSYPPNHYTHIFLHDASRSENCVAANAIMGHDPKVYIGNTLPRKGLKHWRVEGRNRKLPDTMNN